MTPWTYVLLGSVLVNALLGGLWLRSRDVATTVAFERDQARGLASACSDATEDLRTLADKRAAEAKKLQAAARSTSVSRNAKADQILSTPAAVAGDDYASARARIDTWLKGRAP